MLNGASQMVLRVKNLPANAGDVRDLGSIPGSGRSLGGRHGSALQYSCLENPMDRGAWQATVYGAARVRHDRATKYAQYYQWLFSSLGFVRGGEGGPSLPRHVPVSGLACGRLPVHHLLEMQG